MTRYIVLRTFKSTRGPNVKRCFGPFPTFVEARTNALRDSQIMGDNMAMRYEWEIVEMIDNPNHNPLF